MQLIVQTKVFGNNTLKRQAFLVLNLYQELLWNFSSAQSESAGFIKNIDQMCQNMGLKKNSRVIVCESLPFRTRISECIVQNTELF